MDRATFSAAGLSAVLVAGLFFSAPIFAQAATTSTPSERTTLNVEGFPANLGGAAVAGAVAAALAAASGIYALSNWNGKGAQINDNWGAVTCWPL